LAPDIGRIVSFEKIVGPEAGARYMDLLSLPTILLT
jgi:hypothetical protein